MCARLYALDHGIKIYDEFIATYAAAGGLLIDFTAFSSADVFHPDPLTVLRTTVQTESGNASLYNVVLHYWIRMFGRGDIATRMLSLLFGWMTIPAVYVLTLALFRRRLTALVACLFTALHPVEVAFSVLVRSYALAGFLVTLSSFFFWMLVSRGRKEPRPNTITIAYAVCSLLALLTHYLTVYVLVTHVLFAMVFLRSREAWFRLVGAYLVLTAVMAAWFYVGPGAQGLAVMVERNRGWLERAQNQVGRTQLVTPAVLFWRSFALGIDYLGLEVYWFLLSLEIRVRFLLPLLLAPPALVALALRRGPWTREIVFTVLLVTSSFGFCLLAAGTSGHTVSLQMQYSTFTVPFLCILLAGGVTVRGRAHRMRAASSLLVTIVAAAMIAGVGCSRLARRENPFPDLAHRIDINYQPGDIVYYPDSQVAWFCTLYLRTETPVSQRTDAGQTGGYRVVLKRGSSGHTIVLADLSAWGLSPPLLY